MPIRASQRALYPKDWRAIRDGIVARSGGRCECEGECGHHKGERCPEVHGLEARTFRGRVVLTVAHLDHNPANNHGNNLRAMCQACHLRYDADEHRRNAAATRRSRRGVLELFEQGEVGTGDAMPANGGRENGRGPSRTLAVLLAVALALPPAAIAAGRRATPAPARAAAAPGPASVRWTMPTRQASGDTLRNGIDSVRVECMARAENWCAACPLSAFHPHGWVLVAAYRDSAAGGEPRTFVLPPWVRGMTSAVNVAVSTHGRAGWSERAFLTIEGE